MDVLAVCNELASTGFAESGTIALVGISLIVVGFTVFAVRSRNRALVLLIAVGLTVGSLTVAVPTTDNAIAACHTDSGDSTPTDPGDGGGTDPGDGGGTDPGDGGGTDPGPIDGGDGGIVVTSAVNNGSWGENYHPIYCLGFQTPMVQIGDINRGDYIVFDPGMVPGSIGDYDWTIGGVEANSWGPFGPDTVIVWHDEDLFTSGQTVTVTVTDGITEYNFQATFN